MAELYLYQSEKRLDAQGRPLWIKCSSESSCRQMHAAGMKVKKIVFEGEIPKPAGYDEFELDGFGFGAKKKRKKRGRRNRNRGQGGSGMDGRGQGGNQKKGKTKLRIRKRNGRRGRH